MSCETTRQTSLFGNGPGTFDESSAGSASTATSYPATAPPARGAHASDVVRARYRGSPVTRPWSAAGLFGSRSLSLPLRFRPLFLCSEAAPL